MSELSKDEAERNPQVVQQYSEYATYAQQKWQNWMLNPAKFVEEMVAPAIESRVASYKQEVETRTRAQTTISANSDLCRKYENEVSTLMQQGVPLEAAITIMKQHDELATLRKGAPASQSGPAVPAVAPVSGVASMGVVTQAPRGRSDADDDEGPDGTRYANAREAGLAALRAVGQPQKPGIPGAI
jgi:hypothetical protein